MIICNDFKARFYNTILQAQNVVIVPYNDVDSLCATFILTRLFDADEIMYSVLPVCEWDQLKIVFEEHKQVANHFILLNCGGFNSLIDLDLPSNYCVFVLDAQRPFHLDNVFSKTTVKIVCQETEIKDLNLPQPSEIYEDEEEEQATRDEGESSGDDSGKDANDVIGTARRIEKKYLKQQRLEVWRQKRGQILWEYGHKSYTSTPTSVFLLKIAHSMSKTTAALTWAAAVGLSGFQVDQSISIPTYSTICIETMKPHLRQFNINDKNKVDPTLRITFDKELTLPLYRHWTLDESIRLDVYFITGCRLWTQRGRDKVKEVYANLGIPLNECQNSFDKLDSTRRKEISDTLNNYMKTNFGTFFSHKGYARWFSSVDFARTIALKLQFSDPVKSHTELFTHALKFIRDFVDQDGGVSESMNVALKNYKSALESLTQLAYDCINQKRFIQTPSFIGLTITQQCAELDYLRSFHCLKIFIYLAFRVFHGTKRSEKRMRKPFFLAILNPPSEFQLEEIRNKPYYLFSGCMPLGDILSDPERKTFIPRLFTELAREKALLTIYTNIDPNIILVHRDSYADFFARLDNKLPSIT